MVEAEFLTHTPLLALLAAALLAVGGCANEGLGGGDYTRGQTRGEQTVRLGVVEQVRSVKIEGTHSGVGAVAGAGLGGLAGSEVGGGRGSIAGALGGAIIGGIAGQAAEQVGTKQAGVEITVKLESGKLIAITQAADERFNVGDRVRILSGGGVTRVSH
jgi:outer membrane lipoprotein SlyB